MAKSTKIFWLLGAVLILIIIGVRYFSASKLPAPTPAPIPVQPTLAISPTSTFSSAEPKAETAFSSPKPKTSAAPTLTPAPSISSVKQAAAPVPAGPPNGQIVCDYQIPVGPTSYGTAVIRSTWKNILVGKNGAFQTSVCVSVGGQTPTLMSQDNLSVGSRDTTVPWLAPNANYSFLLTDDHGGDIAACSGQVLSSCRINTHLSPTSLPTRPPQP